MQPSSSLRVTRDRVENLQNHFKRFLVGSYDHRVSGSKHRRQAAPNIVSSLVKKLSRFV